MSGDFLAPAFDILVEGKALEAEERDSVLALWVDRRLHMPDRCEVVFQDLLGKQSDAFASRLGAPVEVKLGYTGSVATVGKGRLAFLETELSGGNGRVCRVVAYGPRYQLQRDSTMANYLGGTVGDGLTSAATGSGAQVKVEQGTLECPTLTFAGQPTSRFLEEWASRLGLVILEDDETVMVAPPSLSSPSLTFSFQKGLLEFRAELNTFDQVSEVQVTAENCAEKKAFTATAGKGQALSLLGGSLSGADIAEKAFGATRLEVADMPVQSQKEADQLAAALFNDRLFSFVSSEGKVLGEPGIKTGSLIGLEGLGKALDGSYFVTRVTHVYRSEEGFMTSFEACRPAISE